jgi:5-methylcytosine-specific restriction endonuclease McrA
VSGIDFRIKKYQKLRKKIYINNSFTCQMCGYKPRVIPEKYNGKYTIMDKGKWLEIDHIKPRSLGGKNNRKNLQTLCNICNCKKGAKYGDDSDG